MSRPGSPECRRDTAPLCHNPASRERHPRRGPKETEIKFLRMKPGHGEILLAEGDAGVEEDQERLVREFRRQLDEGMWAAVPTQQPGNGRREAQLVREFAEIPPEAERVIFFPRASGG